MRFDLGGLAIRISCFPAPHPARKPRNWSERIWRKGRRRCLRSQANGTWEREQNEYFQDLHASTD
jgi:hypothetical protein